MASPKTEKVAVTDEERVELFIPRDPSDENQNLFIGINGVNYILPKGQTSKVPKFVADDYYRSKEAEATQAANIDKMKIQPK